MVLFVRCVKTSMRRNNPRLGRELTKQHTLLEVLRQRTVAIYVNGTSL